MPNLTHLIQRILELMKRYPGVIALGGFISGVSSFILVDRQQGMASWIAVIMLVSWLWLMLENSFTQLFTKLFKREIPEPLLRYATQMIHQESLFFVLPFFFVTTAWNSGQSIFTGLLGAAALVSIIDPLYYKWLAPKRSLFLALHTLTLFAALLTALPIILHLTTAESYKLALGVAMALSIPSGGLYAYTAINAPRGLDERIYHVWKFNGKEVDRIALDIHGGRKEGYRAWTHKQNFPNDAVGRWQVQVLTEDGQVIGVLRFKVSDAAQTDNPQ